VKAFPRPCSSNGRAHQARTELNGIKPRDLFVTLAHAGMPNLTTELRTGKKMAT